MQVREDGDTNEYRRLTDKRPQIMAYQAIKSLFVSSVSASASTRNIINVSRSWNKNA